MEFGVDTVLVALIGALATIYGIREARAGRKDATLQQAAANKLAEEKQELEGLRFVLESERIETDRARAYRDEARAEADRERGRRIDCETAAGMLQEQLRRSQSDLAALRLIVLDEVAREAASAAWDKPGQDPPQSW